MIEPELIVKIRHLYFAEHWKIGTIAAELGVHHDTVRNAIDSGRSTEPGENALCSCWIRTFHSLKSH